ncbi:hypothetical protein PSPO01_04754 [Paraphaeosphaeria sporulosa]
MMQGPFPPQPGMQMQQGHIMGAPGPGHPMQQGMMHQGVSGPGGHVSQAGPMGMQSGAPNAHALSHLQPQQAHMFQQQQQQQQQHPGMMNQQMNPALVQQHNAQRAALLHQQHQQAMLQNHQNGMGMGFPQQLNPQQMAALQRQMAGGPIVNLPPHLRQQFQQQQAMQQQQAQQQHATSNPQAAAMAQAHAAQMSQQAAQAQAQAAAQQAHQQQQQQMQQAQQQQAIAMQHAVSQQSNHSQSGSQVGPATSQGPQQGPLRPPSAMSHQGQASPAPQPTPQQQPQPAPQPRQQTPAPNQTPNMPNQPNPQQPTPAQIQQRQAQAMQQGGMQQGQVNPAAAQAQAARMAMMRQSQNQQNQNQNSNSQGGPGILKLMNFVDQLGKYSASRAEHLNQLSTWQAFVEKFFSETGAFLHVAYNKNTHRTKMFEVVYAALPRYFLSHFSTDVENLQVTIDGAIERNIGTETKVECDRAKFIYTYKNQCQVICHGKLTAFWTGGNNKMEWLQFETQGHHQMIPRGLLETLFQQEEINPMNAQQSPRMSKKNQKNQQQRQPQEATMPLSKLPNVGMSEWGLPPGLFHYLEIYETMNNMTSLMTHYHENPDLTPAAAMENWTREMSAGNPMAQPDAARMQGGMPPGQGMQQPQPGMPAGSRTPSGMGQPGLPPNQFMSPAMQNGLLPNGHMSSPSLMQQNHTPSPASHAMAHQQSQSSNTASVNTSPNVSNKRRRSTAKIDVDDGGGDANGVPKVKPSPRIGGNKRVKNNN